MSKDKFPIAPRKRKFGAEWIEKDKAIIETPQRAPKAPVQPAAIVPAPEATAAPVEEEVKTDGI